MSQVWLPLLMTPEGDCITSALHLLLVPQCKLDQPRYCFWTIITYCNELYTWQMLWNRNLSVIWLYSHFLSNAADTLASKQHFPCRITDFQKTYDRKSMKEKTQALVVAIELARSHYVELFQIGNGSVCPDYLHSSSKPRTTHWVELWSFPQSKLPACWMASLLSRTTHCS